MFNARRRAPAQAVAAAVPETPIRRLQNYADLRRNETRCWRGRSWHCTEASGAVGRRTSGVSFQPIDDPVAPWLRYGPSRPGRNLCCRLRIDADA